MMTVVEVIIIRILKLCYFLYMFLPLRFKEVYTDLNSTLISCERFASITVQITHSRERLSSQWMPSDTKDPH